MQKREWAKHAASARFPQKCLPERFVFQCQFHIILWVLGALPVTEMIPVDKCERLQSQTNKPFSEMIREAVIKNRKLSRILQ